jgi:hypothetical protein
MASKKEKDTSAAEAKERLLRWLGDAPQPELYLTVRSVNREGTSRVIAVYLPYVGTDGRVGIWDASESVADFLRLRYRANFPGVTVGGGGMDMGFHLVSTLARALYGDDYAITHRWLP